MSPTGGLKKLRLRAVQQPTQAGPGGRQAETRGGSDLVTAPEGTDGQLAADLVSNPGHRSHPLLVGLGLSTMP